ncbi:AAA family ATPase [Ensifer sp. ENS07]|jgi:chloramphenicol 3-O phosphotransferase|uniref:Chloramphenicol phosphotransferase CPT family protein n=1 Tax=Ensifer adhaerens TaxID=106592 RepID=A0A9Q8Y6E6_ENSAD|nr:MULTISPECIES: AAA family ATPase [Ensifer]MBD9592925.1 AAA family ATPase [Ensifer sp. ENS05]MBD9637798.1 AAA family ATPase [Ensifer sp. ENS07]RAS18599.1 chloramphenicol 3-O phosphotransferase [Ensifer adhaerens]USJ23323.1 chloramphenicol phosphotransferase CPT family protein [Ensifer adhaerens]UTV36653.1 chloramphenicol phosphotransferase CPT family protein [Ensifer adhaerens]
MVERAKIIFIHGASSSGKSTLARAVQAQIGAPFWHVSIDHLRASGTVPMERFRRGDFRWKEHRARFFDGFHRSLVAYASAGNNLLLEHILEEPGWASELAVMLQPFDVFFVALHCERDELIRRERLRADRPIGSAADDFHRIHVGQCYDLELGPGQAADDAAAQLISAWSVRRSPSVFDTLALEARAGSGKSPF